MRMGHPGAPTRTCRLFYRAFVACVALRVGVAQAQGLDDFISPGPLSVAHEDLTGLTQCVKCHTPGKGLVPQLCMDCHERVAEQVATKDGFHGDKGAACHTCHSDHRGREFDMVNLEEETFDHDETGFDLHGAHAETDCAECHTDDGDWTGLETVCRSCHDDPHGSEQARPLIGTCESCHGEVDWEILGLPLDVFDHDNTNQADFALEGEHDTVACEDCHEDWQFVPVEHAACADCHANIHGDQFEPATCEDCHTTVHAGFALRGFPHHETHFPLLGAHSKVSCESCHGDGEDARYRPLPHDVCGSCHDDPHEGQFQPRDCADCHTQSTFALSDFDHDTTDFPLRRDHRDVSCEDCHGPGPAATYADLPYDDCASCHDDAHEGTFGPARCDSCHLDGTWQTETFDHDLTEYPLTGAHQQASCQDCHGEPMVLSPVAHTSCNDCHSAEEPHEGAMSDASCASCHATDVWTAITYDHGAETDFPLTSSHAEPGCSDCHSSMTFGEASTACESCHTSDEPPDHYEGSCGDCHIVDGWLPATLGGADHSSTGFALRGVHNTLACADCHSDDPVGPFCESCHAPDDPHRNLLGNTCDSCHTPSDWFRVQFRHASTGFPLRGSHRLASCSTCHATGFAGTPTQCRSCHDREKPNDALHRDPLTSQCDSCHRPYDWDFVRFPHGGGG
jgi:hypothetical protein